MPGRATLLLRLLPQASPRLRPPPGTAHHFRSERPSAWVYASLRLYTGGASDCRFRWKATYHAIGGGVDDRRPDNKSRMSLGRLWRRLDPQTRYGVVLTLAGSAVYGVIGAVTLPWYMAVLLALVALVLGTTFTLIKRLRREKHPRRE